MPLPTRDQLVLSVEDAHPGGDPLQHLTDAMILGGRLTDLADEVIGHFVGRARESGATWSEIGECLGVTKQAAQKRFVGRMLKAGARRGFFLTRLTEEARQVVRRAVDHARRAGSVRVDTDHLVLGLTDDPQNRAGRVILDLGGSIAEIRSAAEAGLESSEAADDRRHIPFSPDSKKVLELSLREAIRARQRSIGPEHILLGLLRDEGNRGSVVLVAHGITRTAVAGALEEE